MKMGEKLTVVDVTTEHAVHTDNVRCQRWHPQHSPRQLCINVVAHWSRYLRNAGKPGREPDSDLGPELLPGAIDVRRP